MVALLISLIIGALLDRFRLTIGQSTSMIDGAARPKKRFETTWCNVHVVEAHRRDPVMIFREYPATSSSSSSSIPNSLRRLLVAFSIAEICDPPLNTVRRLRRLSSLASKYLVHWIKECCRVYFRASPALIFQTTTRSSYPREQVLRNRLKKLKELGIGSQSSGASLVKSRRCCCCCCRYCCRLDAGVFVQGTFGDAAYFIDHSLLLWLSR